MEGRDPFAVDTGRVLEVLSMRYPDYQVIADPPGFRAWHRDASVDETVTGETPDAIDRAIHADLARRSER